MRVLASWMDSMNNAYAADQNGQLWFKRSFDHSWVTVSGTPGPAVRRLFRAEFKAHG